jgi:DNA-directed RNA polymerase specialized sigma subunit
MPKNIDDYIYNRRKLAWCERDAEKHKDEIIYIKSLQESTIKAIETLPKSIWKTILFMFYIEGISIEGIANYLHFSQVYISKMKSRALKELTKL